MYWLLLLTLVALSSETELQRWEDNNWVTLYSCDGTCIYSVVRISSADSFRVRVDRGYYVSLTLESVDILGEENLAVYARYNAPATTTNYDQLYTGRTPIQDAGGMCEADRYYIVNQNTLTAADLKFTVSRYKCSITTGSATTTTSTSGPATTTSTSGPATTTTSTSGPAITTGSGSSSGDSEPKPPRVAGHYEVSCDCDKGVNCNSIFDRTYTITQPNATYLIFTPDDPTKTTAAGTIHSGGGLYFQGSGVRCNGYAKNDFIFVNCGVEYMEDVQCRVNFDCKLGECTLSSALLLTVNWSMIIGMMLIVLSRVAM